MLDSPLTRVGEQQATLLGQSLSDVPLDIIYSSSSRRALNTARIINAFQDPHCPIMPEDDLREIGLGEWEGMKRAEVTKFYPSLQHIYFNDPENFEPVGAGETLLAVKMRAMEVLNRVLAEEEGRNILMVTHTAVVKILMAYFDGRPFTRLWGPPRVKPASLCHVAVSGSGHEILKYADATHLMGLEHH